MFPAEADDQIFCFWHRLSGIFRVCATFTVTTQDCVKSRYGAAVTGVSHGFSGAVLAIAKSDVNALCLEEVTELGGESCSPCFEHLDALD